MKVIVKKEFNIKETGKHYHVNEIVEDFDIETAKKLIALGYVEKKTIKEDK